MNVRSLKIPNYYIKYLEICNVLLNEFDNFKTKE